MEAFALDARKQRERDFHNEAFGDHRRHAVGRFYAVTERSQSHFSQLVVDRATGKRVLEYGCGEGSLASQLPRAASVTGIDISDVAISRLAASAAGSDRLRYLVMDAENLQFPDRSFDLVCGSGILHHLKLARAYAEIARVLTLDGSAIFFEPLGHNPLINLYRHLTPGMRSADEHPLLISDLRLARCYFGSVDVRFFHLMSLGAVFARRSKYFRRLVQLLDGVDSAIFAAAPWMRKLAWICVIKLEKALPEG